MKHLFFSIWFISQTVGFTNVILTFFVWRRTKGVESRIYFLAMAGFYLMILGMFADFYLVNTGASKAVIEYSGLLTFAAMGLLASVFMEWGALIQNWKRLLRVRYVSLSGYGLLWSLLLLDSITGWLPISMTLFFSGFAISIIFITLSSFRGKYGTSMIPPLYGKLISIGSLVLLPGFILIDMFNGQLQFIQAIIPQGFHIVPLFFVYWSIINLFLSWNKLFLMVSVDQWAVNWGLSRRETEVLKELYTGATYNTVADKLCISLSTVKSHVENIYRKAGVSTRTELLHQIKK